MPKYVSADKISGSRTTRMNPLGQGDSGAARAATQRGKQACNACRHRKIRCDGAQPTCAECIKKGNSCTYSESKKRGRPAKAYTLADLVQVNKPMPPLLQSLMSKHGNASLASIAMAEPSSISSQEPHGKVACLLCRCKKTACSGVRPTCANCAKFGSLCVYPETIMRGRRPHNDRPDNLAPADTPLAMLAKVAAAEEPLAVSAMADGRLTVLAEVAMVEESRPSTLMALLNDNDVIICPANKQWGRSTSGHISGSGRRCGLQ